MPHTSQSLQALKIPDLKALCKELKISNFSKLPKAQLIKRILGCQPADNTAQLLAFSGKLCPGFRNTSNERPTSQAVTQAPSHRSANDCETDGVGEAVTAHDRPLSAPTTSPRGSIAGFFQTNPRVVAPVIKNLKRSKPTIKVTPGKRFQPLKRVSLKIIRPLLTSPAGKLAKPLPTPLPDVASYLSAHWLNKLFGNLNAHRKEPRPTAALAFNGIDPALYSSDVEAFSVALCFWIGRLHSSLQMGAGQAWSVLGAGMGLLGPDLMTWPAVTQCCKIAGEFFQLTAGESYVVLALNGEVLSPNSIDGLRSDWRDLLNSPVTVTSLIRTKDSHDFPGGVSRLWAATAGADELCVAKKAVLSSCYLQSFSGSKLSAAAMDAEWLGRPQVPMSSPGRVELYLPESHQVQSVKIDFPIAHVHRASGSTDFVLCETGQIIGNEDGIVELWQGILGCDRRGKPCNVDEFWRGWEFRL